MQIALFGLYTSSSETLEKSEGREVVEWREINQSEKHETVKTKPKDEEIILIYLRVRIP